ncbi:hypothetical protein TNCV_3810821 [Trichonephila clavipes]|nr:hypothetical protein TNCV_3810821 [Trichonephila clavipes]
MGGFTYTKNVDVYYMYGHWLHRQLRETRSFLVLKHDAGRPRAAVRSSSMEQNILNVVALRPESSSRAAVHHRLQLFLIHEPSYANAASVITQSKKDRVPGLERGPDLERYKIVDILAKDGAYEASEPSASLTFLEIFSIIKHQNKAALIAPPPEYHWCQSSRPGGPLAHGFNRQEPTILADFLSSHLKSKIPDVGPFLMVAQLLDLSQRPVMTTIDKWSWSRPNGRRFISLNMIVTEDLYVELKSVEAQSLTPPPRYGSLERNEISSGVVLVT